MDIFIALKEADAMDILRSNTKDLDFSNFPLTSTNIYTLGLVMKQCDELNSLSLVNCGIDDDLLMVFASNTRGLQLKVIPQDFANFLSPQAIGERAQVLSRVVRILV